MTDPAAWFDDKPKTKTRSRDADVFDTQEDAMPILHRSSAPTITEDTALLQAAQFAGDRDLKKMLVEAKRIGSIMGESAFYSWGGGRSRVEGPTIGLAYALAQVWGRCRTQVILVEEEGSRVKLRGRYIDLLTIAVTERDYLAHLSAAPGKFADKPDQVERWRVMQLQSAASKAVRGAIFGGLPSWLVDAAMSAAKISASAMGGKTLPEARAGAIAHLASKGLTEAHLIAITGQPVELWADGELRDLRALAKGIADGSVSVEAVIAEATGGTPQPEPPKPTGNRLASVGLGKAATPSQSSPQPSQSAAPTATTTTETQAEAAAQYAQATEPTVDTQPEPEPEPDPVLEAIEALETKLGASKTRDAKTLAGMSPKGTAKRLGEKRRGEYLLHLQAIDAPPVNPDGYLVNPEMETATEPHVEFSAMSMLDQVHHLEEAFTAGAVRRVRQESGVDPKAAAAGLPDEVFTLYHGALLDEKALQDEAAYADGLPL